ncbi:MAG: fatty acyl-AMP ligase [Gammaproteobacteria bacterium]|nr:fatty acyl-AMP ligase [Gammaproteobacteria bacterium]
MTQITPTCSGIRADVTPRFTTLTQALDFAALGRTGLNFYSGRGELVEAVSYRQLRDQARNWAQRLLAAGLTPGQRVGLVAETDGDFARAFFACQYAGLVPAPLPLPAALGGRKHYLEHLQRMVLAADAAAVLGPASLDAWVQEACAGLKLVFVGVPAHLPQAPKVPTALPEPAADRLAYLQFSSGSTRFPRAIAVTHRAVIANTGNIITNGLRAGADDRCLSWLPMYHDMGLVGFLLTPITRQMSVDLLPARDFARWPLLWLELISRNRATLAYSPSFGYELCVRRAERGLPPGLDLSSWRVAGIGGDMIRPHLLKQFSETFAACGFRRTAFVASYGMAEASLALAFAPLDAGLRIDRVDTERLEREHVAYPPEDGATGRVREFVHCGPILPSHEVEVRDDSGRALPERRVGVLHVRGPSLMREYFGEPEETARVLSSDGWLNTGDLGYLHDGEIVITGRAKDLIMLNGRNIWPQDLEWTAETEIEALRRGGIAAFSVEGHSADEVVVLFECRSSDPGAREALREAVGGVLRSRHGVVARVVPVPPRTLPQTSSGKLSRSKAKQLYLRGAFDDCDVAVSV